MGDVLAMATAERADLADLLESLTPEQWESPSLCAGWSVRQVAAHVVGYESLGLGGVVLLMLRNGLRLSRANAARLEEVAGWSAERIALVRPLVDATDVGVVFIPNFSLGSVIGSAIAAAAAPFFPSIEIVEAHRETKIDSPSGTAVRTAELIAAARAEVGPVESPHVDQRARGQQVASVPIHSLRRPGVIARQETILAGAGESLTIVHDTIEPASAYGPGIRLALAAARDAKGVTVGLDSFLDLRLRTPGASTTAGRPLDEGGVPGQVARTTGA